MGGAEPDGVLQVLDPDGDAGEGADVVAVGDALVDQGGVGQGQLGVDGEEGVQVAVEGVDAIEGGPGQLPGAHLPGPDPGREVLDGVLSEVHGSASGASCGWGPPT